VDLTPAAASFAPNTVLLGSHAELVIEATGVNHAYEGPNGWVRALRHFEIAIPRNEFLCLLGPSGCGKSSFVRIVGRGPSQRQKN
jgi:ABC-type nitrate/sulfonate/bicarbonate transport system ATPase subunit